MSNRETFTIKDIPVPPTKLSPNSSGHSKAKARCIKSQRASAKICSMHHVALLPDWQAFGFPWINAVVQVVWFRRERRTIDPDNALARLKSTFDGVVDSGVLGDDAQLIHLPIQFDYDKTNPRIEITITKQVAGTCPLCKKELAQ